MKRLLINANLAGFGLGAMAYVLCRAVVAIQAHPPFDEASVFTTLMLLGWGLGALPLLIQGMFLLPVERRLRQEFRLTDLSPSQPAYARTVQLRVPPERFLDELRGLISRFLKVLPFPDDPAVENTVTYRVRYKIQYDYEISLVVLPEQTAVSLVVQRLSPVARFVTLELAAAQILAGLVKWGADRDLIVADFERVGRPERLARDLGNWLPTNDEWRGKDMPSRRPAPSHEWKLQIVLAGAGGFLAFVFLQWLGAHGHPIPKFGQHLPLYIVGAYIMRQVIRRSAPRR